MCFTAAKHPKLSPSHKNGRQADGCTQKFLGANAQAVDRARGALFGLGAMRSCQPQRLDLVTSRSSDRLKTRASRLKLESGIPFCSEQ